MNQFVMFNVLAQNPSIHGLHTHTQPEMAFFLLKTSLSPEIQDL